MGCYEMQLTKEDIEFINRNPAVVGLDIDVFIAGLRVMYEKGKISLEDYAMALRKCKGLI